MEEFTKEYFDEDVEEEEKLDEYQLKLMEYYGKSFANRKHMLYFAKKMPLIIRRDSLVYKTPLAENGKPLGFVGRFKVSELSIKYMENILKWAGFEYLSNSNLLLHTIHEELIQRKWS